MKINLSMTCGISGEAHTESYEFMPDLEGIENELVNLYPQMHYQTFEGFGGAITDAAGFVYAGMSEKNKKKLMTTYFGSENMDYRLVRTHMDSCDFSVGMYEAMSDPEDLTFDSFSFERTEKYILPMLADAKEAAGHPLGLMLSPWTPPAFMKTNGQRIGGGHLKKEYYAMWAEYLCRYIMEFEKRGFAVERISLQNETKAVQTWDSCVYTPEEEKDFLYHYLLPTLVRHNLSHVEVFIWDHNKERVFERVSQVMCGADEQTAFTQTDGKLTEKSVTGAAFHWYSGDHFEALDMVHQKYPDLKLILSESCIEYSKTDANDSLRQAFSLAHEVMGDLNHGMEAFYDWNILLDETGGPNHVGNLCHAPYLYDRTSEELKFQLIGQYFYHFSHFIHPGAVRIGNSRYTDKIEVTAFDNPDGTIAVIFLNRSKEALPVVLRINEQIVKLMIPGESIISGMIE